MRALNVLLTACGLAGIVIGVTCVSALVTGMFLQSVPSKPQVQMLIQKSI